MRPFYFYRGVEGNRTLSGNFADCLAATTSDAISSRISDFASCLSLFLIAQMLWQQIQTRALLEPYCFMATPFRTTRESNPA